MYTLYIYHLYNFQPMLYFPCRTNAEEIAKTFIYCIDIIHNDFRTKLATYLNFDKNIII